MAILDDDITEHEEHFIVGLQKASDSPAVQIQPRTVTITIIDDDNCKEQ